MGNKIQFLLLPPSLLQINDFRFTRNYEKGQERIWYETMGMDYFRAKEEEIEKESMTKWRGMDERMNRNRAVRNKLLGRRGKGQER